MSSQFTATLPTDQAALAEFLRAIFHAEAEVNSFRREVLHWKYFSTHPEWSGPRSYVVRETDRIVAHGGVWPLRLASASAEFNAIHLIDWAASPAAPGTGVLLLRKMVEKADLLVTVGGSSDTQAILPRIGFQCSGKLKMYARVVRPWMQFRTGRGRTWKAPLRLIRNTAWSLSGLPPVPTGWDVARIPLFDSSTEPIVSKRPASTISSWRTVAGLNHLLSCPAARFSAFLLFQSKRLSGYFLLSQVANQTRIVDLCLASDDPSCWLQACRLATRTAAELQDTCEIIAGFSSRWVQEALDQSGFHLRKEDPIYCYDPRKLLGSAATLELSLLDGDACFASDPRNPYLA